MNILKRVALTGLIFAPLVVAPLRAQTATPEGTVITNTATASYTDANGNTYTNVTASASVTVGFLAAVDATSPATVTPASPSSGNTIAFVLNNIGNGTDSVTAAFSAASGVAINSYAIGATSYATLALLNTALSQTAIAAGSSVTVTVTYTVAPGQGGSTIPVSVTETSRRTPATSDVSTTNVVPGVSVSVSVTTTPTAVNRLPSNGTQYSQTFSVQNTGNSSDTFTLTSSTSGSTLSIVSTGGAAGTGSSISLAPGASGNVTVVYTVANNATAGTTAPISLGAVSGNNSARTGGASATVTVVKALLAMTKDPYKDDQATLISGTTKVLPGDTIQYKITVTNNGTASSQTISISDPLPSQVTFVSSSADAAGWTISNTSGTVTATLAGTLAPAATRYFWVRVRVQ